MSISVLSIARIRSDSSSHVASASRCALRVAGWPARAPRCRAGASSASADRGRRCRALPMPAMSVLIRSSIGLNRTLSSSMASRSVAAPAPARRSGRSRMMPRHGGNQSLNRLQRRARHERCRRRGRRARATSDTSATMCGNLRAARDESRCSCRPGAASRRTSRADATSSRAFAIRTGAAPRARCRPASCSTSKSLHSGGMRDEQRLGAGADDAHEEPLVGGPYAARAPRRARAPAARRARSATRTRAASS